ncbi:DUF86 domain-containing protein [Metabacillus fastidiosus]|uniref:DUF86 domain-containing protein n=1 Tax=Metabacillus fastidiosus TaxID=1458 RepID=UPI003D2DE5FD
MYFVDVEKIEARLDYLDDHVKLFSQHERWDSFFALKALERLCQMMIETILDVGNAMIDGFIMRDPGSYEDIIDILLDEQVIQQKDSDGLKEMIHFRKSLVQEYLNVEHRKLISVFTLNLPILQHFSNNIRTYINNELGPVSAFKPL